MRMLQDEEWSKLSNRQIADAAKVDHKTVQKYKDELRGGEFPTPAGPSGEFTGGNSKPIVSLAQSAMEIFSDEELLAECQRRELLP